MCERERRGGRGEVRGRERVCALEAVTHTHMHTHTYTCTRAGIRTCCHDFVAGKDLAVCTLDWGCFSSHAWLLPARLHSFCFSCSALLGCVLELGCSTGPCKQLSQQGRSRSLFVVCSKASLCCLSLSLSSPFDPKTSDAHLGEQRQSSA